MDTERTRVQIKQLIISKRKERALLLLKLCKMKEEECDKIDIELFTLHKMISDVEWSAQSIEVMKALEQGTQELKRLTGMMPIEKVELLLEETEEAIETESQISQILGSYSTGDSSATEEELERELEELMGAPRSSSQLPSQPTSAATVDSIGLPEAPTNKIIISSPSLTSRAQVSENTKGDPEPVPM